MAVIVEQEGNLKYYKVQCGFCNSILKYLNSDEKEVYNPNGYFGPESRYYIICPICKNKVLTYACCEDGLVDYRIKENNSKIVKTTNAVDRC